MINSINCRRWPRGAGLALAFILGVGPAATQGDPQHSHRRSARAREVARGRGNGTVDVLVRFRRVPGNSERALVQGLGAGVRRSLRPSSRWMSIRIPARRLDALADNSAVEFVGIDDPITSEMDIAREASNQPVSPAPETWLSGAGVGIAVVDSGVAQHPDIATLTGVVDFVGNPAPAVAPPGASIDPNGHGTHVAGIMVGNGGLSGGRMAGIAPQASLLSVRVLDALGRGASSDVLAGLQWIADHRAQYGIRVVNLSLGHNIYEPAADDPLVEAVDALWDAGVVVVCSAGNRGRDGFVTITSPCNSRKVITVGATNDRHTGDIVDDKIATYSSRGPTAFDLVAKPDLVAPGNRIVSLRSPGSHFDMLLPDRRVAADPAHPSVEDYYEMSGTSMATPIVTGAVALMLEQEPLLAPATVKARLMMSARKPRFGDPMLTGAGYLDITGALRSTWTAASSLSPRATTDVDTGRIAFENTSVLWGSPDFALKNLWADSIAWTDPDAFLAEIVWTNGERWPDGQNRDQGEMWPNGECWPEGEMWPDSPAWMPAVIEPLESGPVMTEALASGFRDE